MKILDNFSKYNSSNIQRITTIFSNNYSRVPLKQDEKVDTVYRKKSGKGIFAKEVK